MSAWFGEISDPHLKCSEGRKTAYIGSKDFTKVHLTYKLKHARAFKKMYKQTFVEEMVQAKKQIWEQKTCLGSWVGWLDNTAVRR